MRACVYLMLIMCVAGLLGNDVSRDCRRLRKVKALETFTKDKRNPVVSIACGDRHSIALTKSGELFSWGGTLHGKLGRTGQPLSNTNTGSTTHAHTAGSTGPFQVVSALSGKRVVKVACGHCHTAAVTDDGEVTAACLA